MENFYQNYGFGDQMYMGNDNYSSGCNQMFSWGFSAPSFFSQPCGNVDNGAYSLPMQSQVEMTQAEANCEEEDEEIRQKLLEKLETLKRRYADIETEKSVRHTAYTQILEAEYGERIKTLQGHLQIAKKYIIEAEGRLYDEEVFTRRKINLFEAKKQEMIDVKNEHVETQMVAAKTQLYLKQIIFQGSQKYKIYRKTSMAEKKELFAEFSKKNNEKDEMLKKLKSVKIEKEELMAQKSEKENELAMLSEHNAKAIKYKEDLERELAEYKQINDDKNTELKEQKNKMYNLEKEKIELNEQLDKIKKPTTPRNSWRRRFLSFFCIRANID